MGEKNMNDEFEEISIIELINIMLKGKLTIIIAVISCLLLSVVFTFYQQLTEPAISNAFIELKSSTDDKVSVDKHNSLMNSVFVVENVIDELNLVDRKGEFISVDSFLDKFKFEFIEDDLYKLSVEDEDEDVANKINMTMLEEFEKQLENDYNTRYAITQTDLENTEVSIAPLIDKYKSEIMAIDEEVGDINQHKNLSKSLDSKIINCKTSLVELQNNIDTKVATLDNLMDIAKQRNISLDNVNDYDFMVSNKDVSGALIDAGNMSDSILISQIYSLNIEILALHSEKTALENSIPEYQKLLDEENAIVKEYDTSYNMLLSKYNDLKESRSSIQKEIDLLAVNTQKVAVNIISEPIIDETDRIDGRKNVLIGGVLGVFLGILLVFIRHWWKNNKEQIELK